MKCPQCGYEEVVNARDVEIFSSLTGREKQVAKLILLGSKNKEIAVLLGIRSSNVIRAHVISIYDKTGMGSRSELMSFILTRPTLEGLIREVAT